ncbi:DUF1189 family protein [Candidatus Woesearchaeota archaeon]|nr:DUF1189 family protein [Candidatus Woesearchaeota archaeon]
MGKIRKVGEHVKRAKGKVMKTVRPGFWKKVIWTMNPKTYSDLSETKIKKSFSYLLALLFASFILMSIIALPRIISMPGYIKGELGKFDTFNISIDIEMSKPVMITAEDPQIIVDTTTNRTTLGKEKILITDEIIAYRPYGRARTQDLSEFEDLTAKKEETSRFLTFLAILLMPTILITAYIMFLLKYLALILVVTLLLFIGVRIAKKDLPLKKSLNTAVYAATPMILIEVVFIPFSSKYLFPIFQIMGMNFYLVTLAVYLILASNAAYFAAKKKSKKGEEYETVEKVQWDF